MGQGIGTALCRTSIQWAREHGYVAVVAPGAPEGLLEFARWYGHLPWTTYAKLGFRGYPIPPERTEELPGWVKGAVHEPIASEIKRALESRPINEVLERVMVLEL
jgi:GNAT superfamily N-acetyltransferase